MGGACSGLAIERPADVTTLDMDTLERLDREFNEADVGHVGRITRQQFEALLLKRAYDARTSVREFIDYTTGMITD